jgi:hypothetical protein
MRHEKIQVARIQLERALRLFVEEREYASAATLAGAASGILESMLQKRGVVDDRIGVNSFEETKALMGYLMGDESPANLKQLGIWMNRPRNALKHFDLGGDDTALDFSLKEAAEDLIDRATSDLVSLTGEWPDDELYCAFRNTTRGEESEDERLT